MGTLFRISRQLKNKINLLWMIAGVILIVIMPVLILIILYVRSLPVLKNNSLVQLLFDQQWQPLQSHFGFYPFIISSIWVTFLSLIIAGPVCLLTAIHLTQYSGRWLLNFMRPVIDLLAGIPSVIYGVWGVVVVVPLISDFLAPLLNRTVSGYSILAGSLVLAVMIIPFILNILIELFRAIPIELTEASLALGATRWQTVKRVLIPKIFPGIISALGLGICRAFGETIAVLMVVGNEVRVPQSVFHSGYPLPALIANNYGEMLSIPMYDSALLFAALILFVIVLVFNFFSRLLITRYSIH